MYWKENTDKWRQKYVDEGGKDLNYFKIDSLGKCSWKLVTGNFNLMNLVTEKPTGVNERILELQMFLHHRR